jgi:hypothetical protein
MIPGPRRRAADHCGCLSIGVTEYALPKAALPLEGGGLYYVIIGNAI